ncbi:hypothetical protein ACQUY5_26250 [Bacillus cereus]|uniref:hypothetical protein n=1 Tax=Bacillus cereus TaxID=1396 RepID=UPI003D18652C
MILVKEVIKGDKRGYTNGEVEKIMVHSNLNGVVYEFTCRDSFDTWADKLGFKLDFKHKTGASLSEVKDRKVLNYEVPHTLKEVYVTSKEELPTDATRMVGLVCGDVVFCYASVEGKETTIYRPKPQSDWYELLPQQVQDLIVEHGIRTIDFV